MVQVEVWTKIGPTEEVMKVKDAIEYFFPEIAFKIQENKIVGVGEGRRHLRDLKQKIWAKQILDTVRERLLKNLDGNSTEILIHKQAAAVRKLAFVKADGDSPLGAIHVIIQSSKLEFFIDWLAPETIKGKPIKGIMLDTAKY